ncbi:MAG: hypothetical protein LWY06_10880 [Firmicutes bacterium]|nr:hypothetical protein [Bacillota bacterium]
MITKIKLKACRSCRKEIDSDSSYFVIDDIHYCWRCGFQKSVNDYSSFFGSSVFVHTGTRKNTFYRENNQ